MAAARPVLLVWLLLAAVSLSLVVHARLDAPEGTVFSGTFYYADDFYNYLSSVEQAQRGALVFRSKLAPPGLPPALVNLEWLLVGWLAALLGNDPLLAYRVFGLGALLLLVWLVDRWFARSGLPSPRRLPALLLVATGGGVGGLLFLTGVLPGARALDLRTGAFPFVETVGNPHFIAGTTLLLGGLSAFAARRPWLGAATGVALCLVRPYDAALLVAVEGAATVIGEPRPKLLRRLLPVAVVAASLAYPVWLFTAAAGFRVFSSRVYATVAPNPIDVLLALGPALLLALTAWKAFRRGDAGERAHQLRLALWACAAIAIAVTRPVSFSLQFVVGVGLPLLMLAALGLAQRHRLLLPLAVPSLASTAIVATYLCTLPTPDSHPPAERWRVAIALRQACRPGDLVIAPPDIGLYLGALTPCWPFVSHAAAPGYGQAATAVETFYSDATAPSQRAAFVEQTCAAHLILPPRLPPGWLGTADHFSPRLIAVARDRALAVWSRGAGYPCSNRPRTDFR